MSNQGFYLKRRDSRKDADGHTQDSADPVPQRISDIVSDPDFSDQHILAVLNVAEDYNVHCQCFYTNVPAGQKH
jgi:hypothetical protein